jgi:hypothetical protein
MLTAGTAETGEGKTGDVMALLHRNLLDGIGHVGNGDAQETVGDVARIAVRAGGGRDAGGEIGEFFGDDLGIEGLLGILAENRREMLRLDFADADIRVRDGERAAATIAGGAGVGAGGIGAVLMAIIGARRRMPAISVSKARSKLPA